MAELDDTSRAFNAEDGNLYSKITFVGIRASINRHLRAPPFDNTYSLMSDSSFQKSNQMFSAMLKQLQREGLDRAKNHPSIYEGGGGNPKALQRKVWFDVMISFGPRGRGNQRYICFQNR